MSAALGIGGGVALGGLGVALAGMGVAAAMGKCGGNIGGVISVGDCRGEYLINLSNTVFEKIVNSYSTSVSQYLTNSSVITAAQNVTINNPPQNCGIKVSQTLDLNINTRTVISNDIKTQTVKNIMTEINSNIDQQLKSVTGVLSSGGVRDNLTMNVKQALDKMSEDSTVINSIVYSANQMIASSGQNVTINYAKLDAAGLKDYFMNPNDGCEIDIRNGVFLQMTLDSLLTSTIDAYNNDTEVTRSLVAVKQAIENESKGVDTITGQLADVLKSLFSTWGLIVIAIVIGIGALAYFVLKNPEGVKALSSSVSDLKGNSNNGKGLQKLRIYNKLK